MPIQEFSFLSVFICKCKTLTCLLKGVVFFFNSVSLHLGNEMSHFKLVKSSLHGAFKPSDNDHERPKRQL